MPKRPRSGDSSALLNHGIIGSSGSGRTGANDSNAPTKSSKWNLGRFTRFGQSQLNRSHSSASHSHSDPGAKELEATRMEQNASTSSHVGGWQEYQIEEGEGGDRTAATAWSMAGSTPAYGVEDAYGPDSYYSKAGKDDSYYGGDHVAYGYVTEDQSIQGQLDPRYAYLASTEQTAHPPRFDDALAMYSGPQTPPIASHVPSQSAAYFSAEPRVTSHGTTFHSQSRPMTPGSRNRSNQSLFSPVNTHWDATEDQQARDGEIQHSSDDAASPDRLSGSHHSSASGPTSGEDEVGAGQMAIPSKAYNANTLQYLSPVFQSEPYYPLSAFEPIETLGTGTFGRVLLVRLRTGERHDPASYFALKVLGKEDVIRLKQVAHTNNERRILSRIQHPFIVDLYCTYQDTRNCYMLMEYVCGGELFTHLRKAKRFDVSVTRFYVASLVLALSHMHGEQVLYRDLKPENLLLDQQGYLKMADFGFAKALGPEQRTWTLCGTPDYLSPEVIQSQGQTYASDYWALGVLTYEMLCGYPPFYDKTPFGTYEKILQAPLTFPKHVDATSRHLIQSLLTRDVTKRLGNLRGGVLDLVRHPWFYGVDWQGLLARRVPAPIVPVHRHAGDASNFQRYDGFDLQRMPALQPGYRAEEDELSMDGHFTDF